MKAQYIRAMDEIHRACLFLAGACLVIIVITIPYGVFCRYVLNSAASWPEPAAVLLTIVITFFGAAACYRLGIHMNVSVGVSMLPARLQRAAAFIVELLMAVMAIYMVVYGFSLCQATWENTIADFPWLRVGIAYSPIPLGGLLTLLFIIEHLTIGRPAETADPHLPLD